MSGIFLILFSTGVFAVGLKECHVFLKNELEHITVDVIREFSTLSVEGVALAEHLAEQIEKRLKAAGVNPSEPEGPSPSFGADPQRVGRPAAHGFGKEQKQRCLPDPGRHRQSGADNAENSRAGLFFKNMEPNVINLAIPAFRFLRGPASIARQKPLNLLPQWQMEFQVTPGDFFFTTMNAAAGSDLPLSRLYYWNPCSALASNYEKAMLLCVPLITSDGTVIGVCGFEVSAMLFKLKIHPRQPHLHAGFYDPGALYGDILDASKAMYAGNYNAVPLQIGGILSIMAPAKRDIKLFGVGGRFRLFRPPPKN